MAIFQRSTRDLVDYYATPFEVVDELLDVAREYVQKDDIIVDAGAGDGRIARKAQLRFSCTTIAIDMNPMAEWVVRSDYLSWAPPAPGSYVTVCNPPFRTKGAKSKAFDFVHHSLKFSRIVIAVVPLNMRKPSYIRKFASHGIRCVRDEILGRRVFESTSGSKTVAVAIQVFSSFEQPLESHIADASRIVDVPFVTRKKLLEALQKGELPLCLVRCTGSLADIGRVFIRGFPDYETELDRLSKMKGWGMFDLWVRDVSCLSFLQKLFIDGAYWKAFNNTSTGNIYTMTRGDFYQIVQAAWSQE